MATCTSAAKMLLLLCLSSIAIAEIPKGRLCRGHHGHPVLDLLEADFPDFQPEIIRSWEFTLVKANHMYWRTSFYQPRDKRHKYVRVTDVAVAKGQKTMCDFSKEAAAVDTSFFNLDVFVTHFDRQVKQNWATLHFQRTARVYLVVDGHWKDFRELKNGSLPGWTAIGWAKETSGAYKTAVPFGVNQPDQPVHFKKRLGHLVYIFSNEDHMSDKVTIPSRKWLEKNIKGVRMHGGYHLRVAESNGSRTSAPAVPKGWTPIQAGGRCPEQLHDTWMVPVDNTDEHTEAFKTKGFRTYHPQWDPCYFCAYDHEHGSDPHVLMGYDPKFGYTAMKNTEDESHTGFKGHVLELGDDMFMYFQVHAKVADMRRYTARVHTMVIAVTKKMADGKFQLLAELSHKADFGFASGKKKGGGTLPLTTDDAALKKSGVRGERQLNVLDAENLDPAFRYNTHHKWLGQNEHWFLGKTCLCMQSEHGRVGKLEIRDPSTATRSRDTQEKVWLGLMNKETNQMLWRRTAVNRDVTLHKVHIGQRYCGPWYLPQVHGYGHGGVFYTNTHGTEIIDGPALNAIKQFVHKDLDIVLDGKWKAVDTWVGLHRKKYEGHMRNIGNAISPDVN